MSKLTKSIKKVTLGVKLAGKAKGGILSTLTSAEAVKEEPKNPQLQGFLKDSGVTYKLPPNFNDIQK